MTRIFLSTVSPTRTSLIVLDDINHFFSSKLTAFPVEKVYCDPHYPLPGIIFLTFVHFLFPLYNPFAIYLLFHVASILFLSIYLSTYLFCFNPFNIYAFNFHGAYFLLQADLTLLGEHSSNSSVPFYPLLCC